MTSVTSPADQKAHSAPLWLACRALLAGEEAEFFACLAKVLRGFDEDDIHDLRVASRRLREGLALFSPYLPGKKAGRVRKRLKSITGMLGELRNTDEARLFFSALGENERTQSGREVGRLLEALESDRLRALGALQKELGSLRPGALRRELATVRDSRNLFAANGADPFKAIAPFAADALAERAGPLVELLPRASREEDVVGQHRLRIAVKKMRYRLEILSPLLSVDGYRELQGALKRYQDLLGRLHDLDVFADLVRNRLADAAGRRELLTAMGARRSRLYRSFGALLADFPIASLGEKAGCALKA